MTFPPQRETIAMKSGLWIQFVVAMAVTISGAIAIAQERSGRALYAVDVDGTNPRQLTTIPGYDIINSPEISPDGKWIGVDGWNRGQSLTEAHLLFINLETGELRDLGEGAMPSWSPDGSWFVYSHYSPRGVSVRSFDGLQTQLIDERGWGIQWAPDGMKAVYTVRERGRAQLVLYEFVGRSRRHVFAQNDLPYVQIYWNCKWSPDSKQICIKGRRPDGSEEIAIVDVSAGTPDVNVLCNGTDFNPDIGWHPHQFLITLPGRDRQIHVIDSISDGIPMRLPGQPSDRANSGMCWTPDGQTLIFVSGT